jgi:hypothetical protein
MASDHKRQIGEPAKVVHLRDGKKLETALTPRARK